MAKADTDKTLAHALRTCCNERTERIASETYREILEADVNDGNNQTRPRTKTAFAERIIESLLRHRRRGIKRYLIAKFSRARARTISLVPLRSHNPRIVRG